jgi:putative hydrolase of the HAD superfamily
MDRAGFYNRAMSSQKVRFPASQTLFIDADDTLWENNIYFEQAIANFISHLDHQVHTADEVRSHLNRIEHETIRAHGYGLKNFHRSLDACFEELTSVPLSDRNREAIHCFVRAIAEREIELLPEVSSTLADLATRHHLILVTKGDPVEQNDKLRRSGIAQHFQAVEVLHEKHRTAYVTLIEHHRVDPRTTWMIGNSPRSDINPALSAGLNAIFIPHPSTWELEREVVLEAPSGQTLLEIPAFAHLLAHF